MAQQDSYLLNIDLVSPHDGNSRQKLPYTRAELASVVRQTMTGFDAAVTARVDA